jgi:1-acyl-sn-glycerol-3-phosphate acyltransferase
MRRTIFNTPVLSTVIRGLALLWLKSAGWRMEGRLPDAPKFVVAGAYHTSNWDFPFAVAFAFAFRACIAWMGKASLFRWPFGSFFRWMGGIPIDRSKAHGVVAQSIRAFNEADELIMVIAPEGTRKKGKTWKRGFYYIARGANVPIVLGFLDYPRKVGGIGPALTPTGDLAADMQLIRSFFAAVTPRHPEQATPPTFSGEHRLPRGGPDSPELR